MKGKLVAVSGPGAGREEILRGDAVLVGRSSACQIVVQDEQVSRQHAELRRRGDQWVVRDSGSTHGTFVNNRRLGPGESIALRPGDRLRLGPRAEFGFAEAGAGGSASPGRRPMIETKVITYQSKPAMDAGIQQMEAEGWRVTNVQEAKEHGASSCLIIILALTIVGLLILPLLLFSAKKTYTVTFQRDQ
jgi:hypothetical protein